MVLQSGEKTVVLEVNEKFDEVCDSNYKKKLEQISTFIKEKKSLDKDLDILVYFEYLDDISITFGYKDPIVIKRSVEEFDGADEIDSSTGKYMKVYNSLDEYLER